MEEKIMAKDLNAVLDSMQAQPMAASRLAGAKASDYMANAGGSYAQSESAGVPMVVNVNKLNVRNGRGKGYPKVGELTAGKTVNVLETIKGWSKINFGTGEGWVKTKFLTVPVKVEAPAAKEETAAPDNAVASNDNSMADNNVAANAPAVEEASEEQETLSNVEAADGAAGNAGPQVAGVGDVMYVISKKAQVYANKAMTAKGRTLNVGSAVTVLETGEKNGENIYKVQLNTKKDNLVGWVSGSDLTLDKAVGNTVEATRGTGLAADVVKFAKGKVGSKAYAKYEGGKLKMTYCQRFVKESANRAIGGMPDAGSAYEAWSKWSVSSDMSKIPVGAAVYFDSATKNGSQNGHVGVHIGNDEIIHVAGAVKKQSLSTINSNGVHSFRAWGWQGGVPLK